MPNNYQKIDRKVFKLNKKLLDIKCNIYHAKLLIRANMNNLLKVYFAKIIDLKRVERVNKNNY